MDGFQQLVFLTRRDAKEVRKCLRGLLKQHGTVYVADFYDLSGVTPTYQDNNFGWTSLDNVWVIPFRNGLGPLAYTLTLPDPQPLG